MNDSINDDLHKELRVLLHLVQARPSHDLSHVRERIAVLNTLIAGRRSSTA